jgi:hypothetical protein
LLSLLLSACPWAAFAEETTEQAIPTWRVQAGAFSSGFGQSLGVYHRMSRRWDCGFEVSTHYQESKNESDEVGSFSGGEPFQRQEHRDNDDFFVNLDFDFRHWSQLREKLGWFWGPRVGGGYGNSNTAIHTFDVVSGESRVRTNEYDSEYYSASAAFLIGADLVLLKGLSATFALQPVTLEYRWEDQDQTSSEMIDGIIMNSSQSDGDENRIHVDTDFFPAIYLTLAID